MPLFRLDQEPVVLAVNDSATELMAALDGVREGGFEPGFDSEGNESLARFLRYDDGA